MLIVARERRLDRMESLTDLLDSLEATENDDCLEWIRNCTKKWYKNIYPSLSYFYALIFDVSIMIA